MLPGPLASVYHQYKQDTDSIAAWLASTAAAHGYSRDGIQSSGAPSARSGRLKGKARKQAQEAKTLKPAQSASTPTPGSPRYRIAILDFTVLSEYILDKKVPVPAPFVSTLDRLIRARTDFRAKLAAADKPTNPASDSKHSYFVSVLQKVRDILLGAPAPTAAAEGDDGSTPDLVGDVANRFAGLAVYEPTEDFLNAPGFQRPTQAAGDNAVYEAEQSTSLEDVLFAFGSLVHDLNKIRARIEWIWSNYQKGMFDVAAAAIATNTAIDLARNIIDEVMPLTKDHGGDWQVVNMFYVGQALARGIDVDDLYHEGPGDNFNYDNFGLGVDSFLLAYRHVESFVDILSPDHAPIYKDGMYGWYDPDRNRATMTGHEKFQEDLSLLMPFLSELMLVVRMVDGYPVQDEFLRGMEQLHRTGNIPFYVVFAAQVFLDIHHVLRGDAARGFATFKAHAAFLQDEIKQHIDFHKNLKIHNWGPSNDTQLVAMLKGFDDLMKDPVYQVKAKLFRRMRMPVPSTTDPNRILKMSPVLSGLMLYRLRVEQAGLGIAVATAWGSIMYSAHLHNALQSGRFASRNWPDMMVARDILGDSNLFAGDRPTDPAGYMKKYALQMGVSASAVAGTRRANSSLASAAGPRGLDPTRIAPVASMFRGRYGDGSHRFDWTAEHINAILERSEFEAVGSEEEGTLIFEQISEAERREKAAKAKQASVPKAGTAKAGKNAAVKPKTAAVPSPSELIRNLTLALNAETIQLAFPWLTLHRSCWEFLRAVQGRCNAHLITSQGPEYLEKESQLPFVVGYIFGEATKGDLRLMRLAAEGADGFYKESGGRVLETLAKKLGLPVSIELDTE